MLKGVPGILSPELLKVLCEMGHSDRLVIADGNFPAETMGRDAVVIRMDGHGIGRYPASISVGYLCGETGESYGSDAGGYGGNADLEDL